MSRGRRPNRLWLSLQILTIIAVDEWAKRAAELVFRTGQHRCNSEYLTGDGGANEEPRRSFHWHDSDKPIGTFLESEWMARHGKVQPKIQIKRNALASNK
jgi:hypothetical protein